MRIDVETREAVAMFRRILQGLAERVRPEPAHPQVAPPDPSKEFQHPQNAELFNLLRRWWLESTISATGDRLWVHPELVGHFYGLIPANDVLRGAAYNRAVMGNSAGLVFAWATGTHTIFVRLPRELQQKAIEEGGRFDPTYGPEWIEFNAWTNRWGQNSNWDEALKRWIQAAYRESLKLKA